MGGLLLQLAAFIGILILANKTHSPAAHILAYYVLGGALIWLAALLVSNQRNLVVLEQRDLDALRSEKQAVGTDASFFDSGGGGVLGFQVADKRLAWMLRWLVPAFGLVTAGYLVILGLTLWLSTREMIWPRVERANIGMIVAAVVMFVLFLYSRYAAGMGRVAEWHLLRAGGSYMLGNTVFAFLLIVCFGLQLADPDQAVWEQRLAKTIPWLMVLLGAEIFLNFVADIYRPRRGDVESRACYDSRLLGVFSEPGGIAHSIAEAVNYQFGFKVSQTWFYQFLARYLVPLVGVGALVLWLMTSIVIVNPYQRVIIERFGQLVDPHRPLGPGLAFKLPWPLAVAHVQSTDELHQIIIGAKFREIDDDHDVSRPILWTKDDHADEHFNFLVAIRPEEAEPNVSAPLSARNTDTENVAVHILQLSLALQYRIENDRVSDYISKVQNPEDLVRNVAWRELIEFVGTADVDALLGELRIVAGETLRERISARLAHFDIGINVVYVGLQAVHPVPNVARSFQDVIIAQQGKAATIRSAQVIQNQTLSRVAGDRARALSLVEAIDKRNGYAAIQEQAVGSAPASASRAIAEQLVALAPRFQAVVEAELAADRADAAFKQADDEYQMGIAGTPEELDELREAASAALKKKLSVEAELHESLSAVREQAREHLSEIQFDALVKTAHARIGLQFWDRRLEAEFLGLGGQAAQIIAEAQAQRWNTENRAAADLARLKNERLAYRAAPEIYKRRKYLAALVAGLVQARKYFLAFDSGERDIKIRIEAQEVIGPDFSLTGQ